MYDLVVAGGTVVTGSESRPASVAVAGGRIAAILDPESACETRQTIDVTGKLVIPGAIDAHVHVYTPYSPAADTIESASIAAAHGGITTFLFFIGVSKGSRPVPGTSYRAVDASGIRVADFFPPIIAEGEQTSAIDFGIHCLVPPDREVIAQIPEAAALGIRGYKAMLGYHPARGLTIDDYMLMSMLERVSGCSGIAMFHCENGGAIGFLEEKLIAQGQYDAHHFLQSRPNILEAETVHRMAVLTRLARCPMYVVHLSTKEGLEAVRRARAAGADVTVETCPQYLLLSDKDARLQDRLLKMAPPLRTEEDAAALWEGVRRGEIDIVASDHAPWYKERDKLAARDFCAAPFGAPGVETILPLMYSEGVARGRITINRLVQLVCENPARRFGLWPRKGRLAAGADADMVVIDPSARWTMRGSELHSRAGYTGYEGWQMTGRPVMSFLVGRPLLKDGRLGAPATHGRYLYRRA